MASTLLKRWSVTIGIVVAPCTCFVLAPHDQRSSVATEGSPRARRASDVDVSFAETGRGTASRRWTNMEDMLDTDVDVGTSLPASIGRIWADLSTARASQSSTRLGYEATLAIDGDNSSRSETKKDYKAWWQVEFDTRLKITGVEVLFSSEHVGDIHLDAPLTISVGYDLCALVTEIRTDGPMFFMCTRPRYGRRVRITEASRGSVRLALLEVEVEEEPTGRNEVAPEDVHRIICPFLSTVVNEKYLNGCVHTNETLMQVAIGAGLEESKAKMHIDETFKNNPVGHQDICDMEGAANEHISSTAIHDCPTFFEAGGPCQQRYGDTPALCPAPETKPKTCGNPNATAFEDFWAKLKQGNHSSYLSIRELEDRAHLVDVSDQNPIGVVTIAGSFSLLFDIFGTGGFIHKSNLARILLQRKFPPGYRFGIP